MVSSDSPHMTIPWLVSNAFSGYGKNGRLQQMQEGVNNNHVKRCEATYNFIWTFKPAFKHPDIEKVHILHYQKHYYLLNARDYYAIPPFHIPPYRSTTGTCGFNAETCTKVRDGNIKPVN
jgi:hypothetical protein